MALHQQHIELTDVELEQKQGIKKELNDQNDSINESKEQNVDITIDSVKQTQSTRDDAAEYFNDPQRNFGKCKVFCFKNGEPRITIGPHWPLYFCMTSFIIVAHWLFYHYLIQFAGLWAEISTSIITGLVLIFYTITALKNPGLASVYYLVKEKKDNNFCFQCQVQMNGERIHHCEECDVCVKDYDHHCPWTGKCIASGNIKYFNTFITMVSLWFAFIILLGMYLSFGNV